ncbi:MAG: YafY family protein [Terrisporobacter sp.]|uniref:helix-turn-helix transcriptional regulator n=1 Tax=Clostridium sp. TaxID=1506 RepID=UPI00306E5B14
MQINRLFEIIYILLDNKVVTAKQLSERFEVSQRTIYRDVETLSSAGIPVYMSKGKGGGISILPEFILNKAVLTEVDKSEILSSLRAVNAVNLNDIDTDKVVKKLNNLFGATNTDWIEVDFTTWGNAEVEKEIFNKLKISILNKRTVAFTYVSGKGENIKRDVYPLKLYFKGQSWYLYGYCKIRNDYRFFKLRRIKNLCILDENFDLSAPVQIVNEKNMFNEEYITLKMKISSRMAYRVYDEFAIFEELKDGSFIVEIIYPKGQWLFSYVASFGEDCEVLEPEDIRVEMKNKLQKIIQNYL